MSLLKSSGIIAFFTVISRILGFARDMLLARMLGAGAAADAFQLAFTFPNTIRRLFAEGALSVAIVPMYAKKMKGEDGPDGAVDGDTAAAKFSNDVLSIFIWILLLFSALMMVIMPGAVWLLAKEYQNVPGKFELATFLSRVTFPYLGFISLVAMLSGILNARSRFAPGAIAPIFLNIVMISGILIGNHVRGDSGDDTIVALALAIAVSVAGVVQFAYLWWEVRRAGLKLRIGLPKLTPDIKRLGLVILPATFGAGIYQISQFIDTFFATSLPQGSLTLLKMADRLNQMPLGIIGIALGTAILPMLARHIHDDEPEQAQRLQSNAFEIATLLTLPAAAALAVCAPAFVTAFFVGGKFTSADGAILANIVVALVAGLPAYVIVKILNPGFFARSDTRTPVYCALASLIFNVALNIALIGVDNFLWTGIDIQGLGGGIVGLAGATAASATLNCILLYSVLHRRGWFHFTGHLLSKIARQLVAVAAMSGVLWWLMSILMPYFGGAILPRIGALMALVIGGGAVYFAVGWLTGAVDRAALAQLKRRRAAPAAETTEP